MSTENRDLQVREPDASDEYVRESNLPLRLKFTRWLGHQRWIPRGQDRLLRLLVNPNTCPSFLFEVDFWGLQYRGNLAHLIDWIVFCYGAHESSELAVLNKCVETIRSKKSGPLLFLDIGANTGHHTLFMAPIVDRIIAFEPYPPLQDEIRARLALNGLSNVTVIPCGLGDTDEVLDYFPSNERNTGMGSFIYDENKQKTPAKLEIMRGGALLDQMNALQIDIVKIDVEGFEAAVLRGLHDRIQRDRPVILTELSSIARAQFGSSQAFRNAFYPDAHFWEVKGRPGQSFKLSPFEFQTSEEVLIAPAEMASLGDVSFQLL